MKFLFDLRTLLSYMAAALYTSQICLKMLVADRYLQDGKGITYCASHRADDSIDLNILKMKMRNVQITYTAVTGHSCSQSMPGHDAVTHQRAPPIIAYIKKVLP